MCDRTQVETRVAGCRPPSRTASRLRAYLAVGLGAGTLGTTAEAGVITIDVSGFSGINGGVAPGTYDVFEPTPLGGYFVVSNNYFYDTYGPYTGLGGGDGFLIAVGGGLANPKQLLAGSLVDDSLTFVDYPAETVFRYGTYVSPDFGPGSFIGFVDAEGRFGYFEVLWDGALDEFRILSGAYESDPGVAIRTPAVPEPTTLSLMAMGAVGLLAARQSRRRSRTV